MTTSVTVRHNFETAHRLPHLGGKCRSLHGHSWWCEVTIAGDVGPEHGVVVDFGTLKHRLRSWIDANLDHGTMLGSADPLLPALVEDGSKLYVFDGGGMTVGLLWPTVENVAELLRRVAHGVVADIADAADPGPDRAYVPSSSEQAAAYFRDRDGSADDAHRLALLAGPPALRVTRVRVTETHVNAAEVTG